MSSSDAVGKEIFCSLWWHRKSLLLYCEFHNYILHFPSMRQTGWLAWTGISNFESPTWKAEWNIVQWFPCLKLVRLWTNLYNWSTLEMVCFEDSLRNAILLYCIACNFLPLFLQPCERKHAQFWLWEHRRDPRSDDCESQSFLMLCLEFPGTFSSQIYQIWAWNHHTGKSRYSLDSLSVWLVAFCSPSDTSKGSENGVQLSLFVQPYLY